ncbi:hypothetical protein [Streptomyces sp. NL15-2K]|uniref:hypothetical protein n=1 Tax=Streptomyces sp. NL15-2K TaxID=376149 RepID=UPI000F560B76|nr:MULTISPECIES: hypothetical protein [Actinomycetes]WKX13491.1 hypothetical protein Q4V64_40580 [Kutzneria buriramensis]GCB45127.1 hypothetical protein SNL152K_2417 [Streptomyces sp. NL15-2K]
MSTYNINNVNGPANLGDHGRIEVNNGMDAAAVLRVADQLVERLRGENPALVTQAEVIQGELVQAGQEGRPADRGRIRSALETISIGVAAGSGGLALAQELGRILGL